AVGLAASVRALVSTMIGLGVSPATLFISYAYRSIRARSSPIKKAANKLFTIEIRNEDVAGESREPRGFGFIQYFDPEDASDAKYHMDGKMLLGREIVVVFAEENRKKPSDMRAREKNKWQRPFLLWEVALKCPNPIDWLTYHLDRSPAPRPRERSLSRSPDVNKSRSASPIVSRSP
ncbi:hypothetical protein ACJX0J_018295, partial [Zea mays]